MDSINIYWQEGLAFDCEVGNHTVRMDSSGKYGHDSGPGPKMTMLATLAACTGMDVVGILKKMRVPFTGLEIGVEGDKTETYPIVYSKIRIQYKFKGDNLDREKITSAVKLSKEKYCGISAMLSKACDITYSIELSD